MTILFAFAFLGLGAGVYWLVGYLRGEPGQADRHGRKPGGETGAKTNPIQKYIEVSGVRFVEDAEEEDGGEIRGRQPLGRRYRRAERQCDDLGPHAEIGGGRAGTFTFTTNLRPTNRRK